MTIMPLFVGLVVAFGTVLLLVGLMAALHRLRHPPLPKLDDLVGRIDSESPLTLAEYRNLVSSLPPPTEAQIQSFARFVAEADLWYKRLPLYLPGDTFHFFVDPFAGTERVLERGGKLHFGEREQCGFHHSMIPTREYRARFGHLAFSYRKRRWLIACHPMGATISGDFVAAIQDDRGRMRRIPREISEAGAVNLTVAIDPTSGQIWWWASPRWPQPELIDWPEESGGTQAVRRLLERSRASTDGSLDYWSEQIEITDNSGTHLVDPVAHEILIPERERQQREMIAAMRRVTALIHG